MSDFDFGAGDSRPLVFGRFTDFLGNPINLTGATISLTMEQDDGSSPLAPRTGSIVDPDDGTVAAQAFSPGEISGGGFYSRFKAILPGGETLSYPRERQLFIVVTPDGSGGSPFVPPAPPSWSVDGVATGALQLVTTQPPTDDAVVRVKDIRADFYLDRSSALAADNITVAVAVGGGRWIRKPYGDLYWQVQTAWFYDNAVGDNEATGLDSGHPIKNMAEIWRRTMGSVILAAVSITVVGTLSDDEAEAYEAMQAASARQWSLA